MVNIHYLFQLYSASRPPHPSPGVPQDMPAPLSLPWVSKEGMPKGASQEDLESEAEEGAGLETHPIFRLVRASSTERWLNLTI